MNYTPRIIVKAGDPILKASSKIVTNFGSKELYNLVEELFYNLKYHNGVGIAAPQIGENQRVLVYGCEQNARYPDFKPITNSVLINPEISFFSQEKLDFYEGCLSLPNIRGLVSRSKTITIKANDINGEIIEKIVSDFEARIIQHELDHLDGILFPMRMSDISTLIYSDN